LENLDDDVEIKRAWEILKENIISTKEGLGYYELKKLSHDLTKEGSGQLHQRKQAKLQRLSDPRQINWDNLNNGRHEARRYFTHKKNEGISERQN
jgi:hypothetical protein